MTDDGRVVFRLYNTNVVEWVDPSTVILRSASWLSPSTASFANALCPVSIGMDGEVLRDVLVRTTSGKLLRTAEVYIQTAVTLNLDADTNRWVIDASSLSPRTVSKINTKRANALYARYPLYEVARQAAANCKALGIPMTPPSAHSRNMTTPSLVTAITLGDKQRVTEHLDAYPHPDMAKVREILHRYDQSKAYDKAAYNCILDTESRDGLNADRAGRYLAE
jgi:hypothetical protein